VIGYGFSMFVRNLLMMAGAGGDAFRHQWKLALLVLLGVPATLVPILLLGPARAAAVAQQPGPGGRRSAYVDEAVHEIRTVQA